MEDMSSNIYIYYILYIYLHISGLLTSEIKLYNPLARPSHWQKTGVISHEMSCRHKGVYMVYIDTLAIPLFFFVDTVFKCI